MGDNINFGIIIRIFALVIIWILILFFLSYSLFKGISNDFTTLQNKNQKVNSQVSIPAQTPSQFLGSGTGSVPSTPQRKVVDFFSSEPEALEQNDDYTLPDFKALESKLLSEQMIKDLPKDAKLRIGFMRYVNGFRKWDKLYSVSKNTIEEKNSKGDIDIWMDTRFVFEILNEGFCPVMERENKNRNIGMNVNLPETKLFFKYAGMLKYKSCLGM